jgi:signal transduction histidine kinase
MRVRRVPLSALSRWGGLGDTALAGALLVFVLLVPPPGGGGHVLSRSATAITFTVVACLALAARNRWPLAVLAVVTAAVSVVTACTTTRTAALVAVLVALYTVAVRTGRRTSLISWVAATGALLVSTAFSPRDGSVGTEILSLLAWTALATAVGDSVRNRRSYVASVEERALRAEDALHEEARRQVAEERLRIARELHDVVAHHMAVVTVQAGVAGHLIASDPNAAAVSLEHIKRAGRTVLDELSGIMTVLRDPNETATSAPSPGLSQLGELIDSFQASGLTVALTQTGAAQTLGPAVDLVAVRVLQEALTNAHKHGTGSAHAAITYAPETLSLCVTNPTGAAGTPRNGHGLIGMKERSAAVGGQLFAGLSRDGQFQVRAILPLATSRS